MKEREGERWKRVRERGKRERERERERWKREKERGKREGERKREESVWTFRGG